MSKLLQKFRQDVLGLLFMASGLFLGLALFSFNPTDPSFNSIGHSLHATNLCGYVGSFFADTLFEIFGLAAWVLVACFVRLGVLSFGGQAFTLRSLRVIWASIAILTLSSLLGLYLPDTRFYQSQIMAGGIIGLGFAHLLTKAVNHIGAQILLWTTATMLTVFYSEKTVRELLQLPVYLWARLSDFGRAQIKARPKKKREEKVTQEPVEPALFRRTPEIVEPTGQYTFLPTEPAAEDGEGKKRKVVLPTKVSRQIENWQLPKLSLLEDPPAARMRVEDREIKKKVEILHEKFGKFAVTGEVVKATPGPAVTMFEFRPDANVKVSEVTALAKDLKLALASESLRILAPIPGRDVVGIETSNAQREIVYFKDMLGVEDFWADEIRLPMALGKTSTGEPRIVDLRRMPHLMVAGTTGSGKSVFTVSLITGLLFRHSPKTLRLIIVDPKQVDYAAFEKVPHLLMPVIGDSRQAVVALRWSVAEMEKRYRSMSKFGARNLDSFNEVVAKLSKEQSEEHEKINAELEITPGKKAEKYYWQPQPYIVIILEEFGDLMTVDKSNVEHSVVRLAQKARACGMHLVLAMQSPRKEVVTGLIKTNIPGRIAFKVSSLMDSRVILDEAGAECLLEKGDMLFKSPGSSSLVRHHGPFLKDQEVVDIAKFWAAQGEPQFEPTALRAIEGDDGTDSGGGDGGDSEYDERYDEILAWAASQKSVSASLIQRRFSLGYPRAARLIETFEREGVVGPAHGSKPRQVLVNSLASLDE